MQTEKKPDYFIDFVIRHLWHKIARIYNSKASEYDLTLSSGFILLNIQKEGTPSTQLGPKMGMEPTSLSRTLKNLEEKGLIFRKQDLIDKRKVLIFLTEDGLKKRRIAKNVVLELNEIFEQSIPPKKLKTFFEVAESLDETLNHTLEDNI